MQSSGLQKAHDTVVSGRNLSRDQQQSSDRYSYIPKANFDGSAKEVVPKKSDRLKSELISFMQDHNQLYIPTEQTTTLENPSRLDYRSIEEETDFKLALLRSDARLSSDGGNFDDFMTQKGGLESTP